MQERKFVHAEFEDTETRATMASSTETKKGGRDNSRWEPDADEEDGTGSLCRCERCWPHKVLHILQSLVELGNFLLHLPTDEGSPFLQHVATLHLTRGVREHSAHRWRSLVEHQARIHIRILKP